MHLFRLNRLFLYIVIHTALSIKPTFSFAPISSGFSLHPSLAPYTSITREGWKTCNSSIVKMGLKTEAAKVVLKDYASGATGYFNSIRTPASLLAGSSLASLFLFKDKIQEGSASRIERLILNSYHVLMLVAYALSITTIFISTAAGVTVMYGDFDPMAKSLYILLQREFSYEFVCARWSFLISLLCFLLGVTNRAVLTFDLLDRENRDSLIFVVSGYVALVAHLLSYINQTLYCWQNIFGMTGELLKLIFARILQGKHPLELLSLTSFIAATCFAAKLVVYNPFSFYRSSHKKVDNTDGRDGNTGEMEYEMEYESAEEADAHKGDDDAGHDDSAGEDGGEDGGENGNEIE